MGNLFKRIYKHIHIHIYMFMYLFMDWVKEKYKFSLNFYKSNSEIINNLVQTTLKSQLFAVNRLIILCLFK